VEGNSDCGAEERCESDVHCDDIATLFSRVLTTDMKYFRETCGLNMYCLYSGVACCVLQDIPSLSFQADPCVKMEPENTEIILPFIWLFVLHLQCKIAQFMTQFAACSVKTYWSTTGNFFFVQPKKVGKT